MLPPIQMLLAFSLILLSITCDAVLVKIPMTSGPGNISAGLPNQLPICVNTIENPDWQGTIDAIGCGDAYQLVRSQVQENLHSAYNFFSTQALPSGGERPPNGWPLPQGSSSGELQPHERHNLRSYVRIGADIPAQASVQL